CDDDSLRQGYGPNLPLTRRRGSRKVQPAPLRHSIVELHGWNPIIPKRAAKCFPARPAEKTSTASRNQDAGFTAGRFPRWVATASPKSGGPIFGGLVPKGWIQCPLLTHLGPRTASNREHDFGVVGVRPGDV